MRFYLPSRRAYSCPTIFHSTAQAAIIPKKITDLRAAWLMDETSGTVVNDYSGSGYTSSSLNGTTIVDGRYGKARNLVLGDFIQFAASPIPDPGAFSIAFWFNPTLPTAGNYAFIGRFAQTGGQCFLSLSNTGGTLYMTMCFRNNTQFRFALTPGNPTSSVWNFMVVTYSGGGKSTQASFVHYLNGALATFAANDGTAGGSINDTQIGTDNGGSNNIGRYVGAFDSYLVFGHVLTLAEVTSLMNATSYEIDTTSKVLFVQ
jgi:hypothetical protein